LKFAPTVVENFNDVGGGAVKIVGISDDHDLVARLREGCPRRARRESLGGALAALLSRRHPPGCEQGHRRHDVVKTSFDPGQ
jgi:hypothetical protein